MLHFNPYPGETLSFYRIKVSYIMSSHIISYHPDKFNQNIHIRIVSPYSHNRHDKVKKLS